jgi:hypothetical protein
LTEFLAAKKKVDAPSRAEIDKSNPPNSASHSPAPGVTPIKIRRKVGGNREGAAQAAQTLIENIETIGDRNITTAMAVEITDSAFLLKIVEARMPMRARVARVKKNQGKTGIERASREYVFEAPLAVSHGRKKPEQAMTDPRTASSRRSKIALFSMTNF